jgi:hypothetical protein
MYMNADFTFLFPTQAKKASVTAAFINAMGNDPHFHTGFKNDVEISDVEVLDTGVRVHFRVKTTSQQGAGQVSEAVNGGAFATELASALGTQGIKAPAQGLAVEAKVVSAPVTGSANLGDSSGGGSGGGGGGGTVVLTVIGVPMLLAVVAIAGTKLKRMRQAHARRLEEAIASTAGDESAHLIQNVINDEDAFTDTEDVSTLSSYSNVINDDDDGDEI